MTIIIGKRSNLSLELFNSMSNCVLISSEDITNNIEIIGSYCNKSVNIIFNNFQASTSLNENTNYEGYVGKTILTTSKVLTYLIENSIEIDKLIYTSSSSVYGNNKFCTETDQVQPMSLQGALKVANEELIKRFCVTCKVDYVIVRLFNMYGKNDNFSVISKINNACKNNKILNIINNGTAVRDYIHIDDVVSVYKVLLSHVKIPKILNVASGKGNRVVDLLNTLENNNFAIKSNNIKAVEISASIADISELTKIVNVDKFREVKDYLLSECQNR